MVMDSISNKSQLLLIVNGTAGTGKSTVISSISHALPAQQVVRAAFTASAAFLIRGSTLHSFFSLPVSASSKKTFSSLSGINARLFQEKFRPISLLIIDEYSMLSKAMLCMIDRRLRDAKSSIEPFGGLSVVLVGDPAQLLLVADISLSSSSKSSDPLTNEGENVYRLFTKVITLTEVRRQVVAVGDVNQQQFINTLLNVRNGKCILEDWRFLQTRTKGRIVDFETRFSDALHLFATNEKVNEFNTKKLQELQSPVTLLQASLQ